MTYGDYPIREVIAQSVVGHRMWREGSASLRRERFVTVDHVQLMHDEAGKQVWARVYVRRQTLQDRGRGLKETLVQSALAADFRAVTHPHGPTSAEFHVFEQTTPVKYTGRAADVVMKVIDVLRPKLWESVTAIDPYRRFYLYLSPPSEKRMPQWMSVYATFFWLGSLTRYQPVELLEALDGTLGAFFREFLETQPSQLLYILASEVKQQDVTKAAIV